ncbi:MAG: BON domain-containing protein, partial [Giesbergeria sp.]|nr:BON domain-containing protein [Giesbergeria sp.]
MGLFSFIKDAGEKLFGGKEAHAAPAPAGGAAPAAAAPSQTDLNARAAQAIEKYVNSQNLGASDVDISYDGGAGKVTVKGTAPTQAIKEKVTLCCGNVASVTSVENQMTVTNP